MDEQLKNLKFSTKSIMITDKQKEFIKTLIDEVMDFTDEYNNIEYWKLSKQDATKLIKKLKNELDGYSFTYDYDGYYGGDMYTDGFKD